MQTNVWSLFHESHPNDFVMLGTDVMASGPNGVQLVQFRINAGGLTFPLLRDCADGSALSDTNLIKPYNQRDNYVVIDGDGIIRYHADDAWDYGNRLHLDELYPAINSALTALTLSAPPPRTGGGMQLEVSPNPFSRRVVLSLAGAARARANFRVLDLSGRQVAAFSAAGGDAVTRVTWDALGSDGRSLAPGLYLMQVESGGRRLTRRLVLTR